MAARQKSTHTATATPTLTTFRFPFMFPTPCSPTAPDCGGTAYVPDVSRSSLFCPSPWAAAGQRSRPPPAPPGRRYSLCRPKAARPSPCPWVRLREGPEGSGHEDWPGRRLRLRPTGRGIGDRSCMCFVAVALRRVRAGGCRRVRPAIAACTLGQPVRDRLATAGDDPFFAGPARLVPVPAEVASHHGLKAHLDARCGSRTGVAPAFCRRPRRVRPRPRTGAVRASWILRSVTPLPSQW